MQNQDEPLIPISQSGNAPGVFSRILLFCFASFWAAFFGWIAIWILRQPGPPKWTFWGFVWTSIFFEVPAGLAVFMACMAILMVVGPGGKFHRFTQKRGLTALICALVLLLGPFVAAVIGMLF